MFSFLVPTLMVLSAQGLAVAWSGIVVFDLVVISMTLARTIQINRRSGRDRTLTRILIRDGKGAS